MFLSKLRTAAYDLRMSFVQMTKKEHFFYWVLPLILTVGSVLAYYTGTPFLQEIIAPRYNREFGMLENISHVIILIIAGMSINGFLGASRFLKMIYAIIFTGSVFVFLEEIDYGLHWVDYIKDQPEEASPMMRNLHNRYVNTTDIIKAAMNIGIAIVFFIIPYFFKEQLSRYENIRPLVSSKKMIFGVFVLLITGWAASLFEGLNINDNYSLAGNRAEFDELAAYYLFMTYVFETLQNRKSLSVDSESAGK